MLQSAKIKKMNNKITWIGLDGRTSAWNGEQRNRWRHCTRRWPVNSRTHCYKAALFHSAGYRPPPPSLLPLHLTAYQHRITLMKFYGRKIIVGLGLGLSSPSTQEPLRLSIWNVKDSYCNSSGTNSSGMRRSPRPLVSLPSPRPSVAAATASSAT